MLDGRYGDNISKEKTKMHNSQYVSRKQLFPVKKKLIQIITVNFSGLERPISLPY